MELARQMRCGGDGIAIHRVLGGCAAMEKDNHYEVADGTSRARPGVGHFGGTRVLLGPEGRAWTVHEAPAAHVPGARARQCLIFDTTGHCFRVWQYPIDWRELTSAELMALGGITPDD